MEKVDSGIALACNASITQAFEDPEEYTRAAYIPTQGLLDLMAPMSYTSRGCYRKNSRQPSGADVANSLQHYLHAFSGLNLGSNPKHPWCRNPSTKNEASPYKPLLLLSVLDLIEDRTIIRNRIPIPDESLQLHEAFHQYWGSLFPGEPAEIVEPYVRLANDVPWQLNARKGGAPVTPRDIGSISKSRLAARVSHASFEDDLFALLQQEGPRRELRRFLVRTYFVKRAWKELNQYSRTNVMSEDHARWLIEKATGATDREPRTREAPVREAGFRKAVVRIYHRQCAFCRLRIHSPENHTVVQAAHIIPYSEGRDEDPRNGLALCGVCHWTFDKGLLYVTEKWRIRFSQYLEQKDQNIGYLKGIRSTEILLPQDERLQPRRDSLEWHRTKVFIDSA